MKKQRPLLGRLESALTQTSSDSEKDLIIGLTYMVAKKTLNLTQDHFYSKLTQNSLDLKRNRKIITPQTIIEGKKLYEHLQQTINLPQNPRIEVKKLQAAIKAEYEILMRYFQNE